MQNLEDIIVPDVTNEQTENVNYDLSFIEMWIDGIKATKAAADPISDVMGCCLGSMCCVAATIAQNEDNKETATRHDVIHADRIRRNEEAERNAAYSVGRCLGDAAIDTVAISVGSVVGLARASIFKCTGNTDRNNNVLGFSREEIDNVNLFDSCSC